MTALLDASGLACPPRFATARDLSRPTLGPAVAKVAERLGKPLMPWQAYVADVVLEIDPATGQLAYDEVGITVPRQSGKTTWKLSKAIHRCSATPFFGPRQHVVYTAQTRKDARKKFIEEFWPDIESSATFASRANPHWSNGDEHIRFANKSWFGIEATTEKAGHGGVLDEAYIDEAFAQVDDRLEQAFEPAMATRANRQLIVVSTAGWLNASPYLLDKVTVGRDYIASGEPGRLAYFEWSAHPDDDPEDESVWWRCMPALGHTISIETVRSALQKAIRRDNLNGFRRAYLNQWVTKEAPADSVIDTDTWAELANHEQARPNPVALAVEVSDDRRWSTIALAGRRSDGGVHVQIVQTGRGSAWVADRLVDINQKHRPTGIAVAVAGPAGSLVGELERRRLPVVKVTPREAQQAAGLFVERVEGGAIAHGDQPVLNIAVGAAKKRRRGDLWEWAPRDATTDVSPIKAVTNAMHALDAKPRRGGRVW